MALEWGDKVRILAGPHEGTEGWITGLDKSDPYNPLLGVEREDCSVVRVPWDGEERVTRVPDPEAEADAAAYDEGVSAQEAGSDPGENPYPQGDLRAKAWLDGHLDAGGGRADRP